MKFRVSIIVGSLTFPTYSEYYQVFKYLIEWKTQVFANESYTLPRRKHQKCCQSKVRRLHTRLFLFLFLFLQSINFVTKAQHEWWGVTTQRLINHTCFDQSLYIQIDRLYIYISALQIFYIMEHNNRKW